MIRMFSMAQDPSSEMQTMLDFRNASKLPRKGILDLSQPLVNTCTQYRYRNMTHLAFTVTNIARKLYRGVY